MKSPRVESLPHILVTGGTGALGSAIVRRLCREACVVTANFSQDQQRARKLADETGCQLAQADVAREDEVAGLFGGRSFDHVVHGAGWNSDALLLRQSAHRWSECLRQNADGAFLVIRESLRVLPRGGHILVLSSRVGTYGNAGQSAYAAAKGAVTGLTLGVAGEAHARGLCLNIVFPGFKLSNLAGDLSQSARQMRSEAGWLPDANAASALAEFVTWELAHNRSNGQIFSPDCRIEGGGNSH